MVAERQLAALAALVNARFKQSMTIPETFFAAEAERVARACWEMARRFHQGGRLLAFGNGPLATDAQHVSVEFVHPVIVGKRALPALALTNDSATLSSQNASGDGMLFARQVEVLARPQDIVMGFSLAGCGAHIAEALQTAKRMGVLTLALTSGDGAALRECEADYCFTVHADDPLVIQETYETLYHVLWELVHVFFEHEGLNDTEGSEYDRLFYPYLFESRKASKEDVLAQVQHSTLEKCREVIALRRATLEACREQIVVAGQAMAQHFGRRATLLAFGNGGSTTDAQDIVAELLTPPFPDWQPLPAIALTNDIAVITAVGNDVGFDNIYARQVIAFGRSGDIALGISTSGNSANVLVALEQAKRQGLLTIGLAGYDGGKMARSAALDFCITAPSDHIPRIQEAQATAYHALLEVIQALMRSVLL